MLRLKNPISQPVRNWWFDCPDGTRVVHPDARGLFVKAMKHGVTGDYETWHEKMVHNVCLALTDGVCTGEELDGDIRTQRVTFKTLIGYTKAAASVGTSLVKGEDTYVAQAEADRRAAICLQCRYNTQVMCAGCHGLIGFAQLFLCSREVVGQSGLGSCDVCGCFLSVSVWCSDEVLNRLGDHKFPTNCWRYHGE